MHGGASPAAADKRALAVVRAGLGKLVTPIDENDPELDPFEGFKMELRRTLGAIRYYEEKIAELREEDAFWGVRKEEDINAGSGETFNPGTNVTREAGMNVVIVAWQTERKHLTELHKIWITAKLDERWLALQERQVDDQDKIITAVVLGLGRDPKSPEVRDVVRRALLGLRGATPHVVDA